MEVKSWDGWCWGGASYRCLCDGVGGESRDV